MIYYFTPTLLKAYMNKNLEPMVNIKSNLCKYCNGKLKSLGYHCVDKDDLSVLKCASCELIQLSSFTHINRSFYSSKQFTTQFMKLNQLTDFNESLEREALWNKKRLNLIQYYISQYKTMKVLDYGCGLGGFLNVGHKKFNDLVGYDLSKEHKDFAIQNGCKVINQLDDLSFDPDIVVLFHVLEHIKKPWELIQDLISKFKSLKYLIIEVPNTNEILNQKYKNSSFRKIHYSSDHLYYFTHDTLFKILKIIGIQHIVRTGIQRYSLANHFGWLLKNKAGGQYRYKFLNNKQLNYLYEKLLVKNNLSDSIFFISKLN
tara:strand:- start:1370 stop:2317 length:948 start_codon:yes stop_codon:yes gene_type:complete